MSHTNPKEAVSQVSKIVNRVAMFVLLHPTGRYIRAGRPRAYFACRMNSLGVLL